MARTIEIPKQDWAVYFEGLSRRALSHPVRIEVDNRDVGGQELNRRLPLVGIDLETKGSEAGSLEVTLGDERQQFSHLIEQPVRVFLRVDDAGMIDCIDVEDSDEGKTLIFFEGGLQADFQQVPQGAGEHASAP